MRDSATPQRAVLRPDMRALKSSRQLLGDVAGLPRYDLAAASGFAATDTCGASSAVGSADQVAGQGRAECELGPGREVPRLAPATPGQLRKGAERPRKVRHQARVIGRVPQEKFGRLVCMQELVIPCIDEAAAGLRFFSLRGCVSAASSRVT